MSKIHVFLDESGAYGYNFASDGCTSHVVIAGILISEEDLNTVTVGIDKIRQFYFPKGEIKSGKKIARNPKKRKKILEQLLQLPFSIAILSVDKRKIREDSYLRKYKPTFYKFVYQFLYHELIARIQDISIHADEIGEADDLAEFKKYYYKKNQELSLFNKLEFAFDNSKNSLCVQLADFIAGSVAYNLDKKYADKNQDINFINILYPRIVFYRDFPQSKEVFLSESKFSSIEDKRIAEIAIKLADDFLIRNLSEDDECIKQQIAVIEYLRFRFLQNQFRRYIPTKELITHLNNLGFEKMSTHTFRMKIIAKLRDEGVIIASSGSGYKLPSKVDEVCDFLNHGKNVILPMVSRLKICNETIRVATNDSINLLARDEFKDLSQLLFSTIEH